MFSYFAYLFSHQATNVTHRFRTAPIMVFEDEDTLVDWKSEPTYPELLGSDVLAYKTKCLRQAYHDDARKIQDAKLFAMMDANAEKADPSPCKRQCVAK